MAALTRRSKFDATAQLPAHTPGTPRGEELVRRYGPRGGTRAARPRPHGAGCDERQPRGPRADRPADAASSPGVSGTSRAQAIAWTRRRRHESRRARRRNALSALASLRRYVRPRAAPVRERCELCDAELAPEHAHLLEPATRRLACACEACALLFDGQVRAAIPPRAPPRPVPGRLPPDRRGLGRPLSSHRPGVLRAQHAGRRRHRPVSQPGGRHRVAGVARGVGDASSPRTRCSANSSRTSRPCWSTGSRGPTSATASASTSAIKLVGVIRTKWRGLSGGQRGLGRDRPPLRRPQGTVDLSERLERIGRFHA